MKKEVLENFKREAFIYLKGDFLMEILAAVFFAVGVSTFSAPNNIVGGGVTGIAIIINSLFNVPIGFLTFCLNLPLIIVGLLYVGKMFMLRTFRVVIIMSFITDFITPYLPQYRGNDILASLFAGVFIGITLGIILMRGGSTGGSDILVKLIQKNHPHMQLGSVVFMTDLVVILLGSFVFRDIEVILLGIICTYAQSEVINRMIKGEDERWMLLSITAKYQEVADSVMDKTDRGATIVKCFGAYSKSEMGLVLCVMESREILKAKKAIKKIDPKAFTVVSAVAETLGEGFKEILKEEN